jgi:hypothetical protein
MLLGLSRINFAWCSQEAEEPVDVGLEFVDPVGAVGVEEDSERAGGLGEIVDLVDEELEGVGELFGVAPAEDEVDHGLPFAGGFVVIAGLRQDTDEPARARS